MHIQNAIHSIVFYEKTIWVDKDPTFTPPTWPHRHTDRQSRHRYSQASTYTFLERTYALPRLTHNSKYKLAYPLWGSNPRPMAHKTIALTTELRGHKMPDRVLCQLLTKKGCGSFAEQCRQMDVQMLSASGLRWSTLARAMRRRR